MRYGYTFVYVADVATVATFYDRAFGFAVKFAHPGGDYVELETGGTTLAFASHSLAGANFDRGYQPLAELQKPAGVELGFVTEDVEAAVEKSVAAGAELIAAATTKPWGQTVAYVRGIDGSLIELCTPISSSS